MVGLLSVYTPLPSPSWIRLKEPALAGYACILTKLGSKCSAREILHCVRMTIEVSDAGYRNVTREHWEVCWRLGDGLHFCNPRVRVAVFGG